MNEGIDRKILKNYEIIQKIGRGRYGIVWKGLHKKDKSMVAIKKIHEALITEK